MRKSRRHPRFRGASDIARAVVVVAVAFVGYQAAASDGAFAQSTEWLRDLPAVTVPGVDLPDLKIPDILKDHKLWVWRGASAGEVRTVVIDIDDSIYPVDGVEWFVNGTHDRFDRLGPLDEELGLWHSRTQSFESGDVIEACWQSADGQDHCPSITVR